MPARISPSCRPPAGPRTPLKVLRHHVTRTLPYSPDQLFALVGDVEAYSQFVPWIVGMRTWNSRTDSQGMIWTDAEAKVGFSFLKETFSTRVRRDPANAKNLGIGDRATDVFLDEVSFARGPASSSISTSNSSRGCSGPC